MIFSSLSSYGQKSDVLVGGYFRRDGSFIQPHYRTSANESLFDNYSTKGNINPYTGKAGWIDPYSRLSVYSGELPSTMRVDYEKVFLYLNKKDSGNYFKIVNRFDIDFRLFFTGLYKMNVNEQKEANEIFLNLKSSRTISQFIASESSFWFDITSQYLAAEVEYLRIYSDF